MEIIKFALFIIWAFASIACPWALAANGYWYWAAGSLVLTGMSLKEAINCFKAITYIKKTKKPTE